MIDIIIFNLHISKLILNYLMFMSCSVPNLIVEMFMYYKQVYGISSIELWNKKSFTYYKIMQERDRIPIDKCDCSKC